MSAIADNGYMYGGSDGTPVSVTTGGNVATAEVFSNIINVGKVVLRANETYQFPDCPCTKISLYVWSSNTEPLWLGGIADQASQVGLGTGLPPGLKKDFACTNSSFFTITAQGDGDTFSYIIYAAAQANNVTITPQDPSAINKTIPAAVSSTPPATALQPINSPITILMNVEIDPSSITSANVYSIPAIAGATPIPDSTNPNNVILQYSGLLQSNISYTVYVQNLMSVTGYTQTAPYSYTFSTSNTTTPPDMTPPKLTSSNPIAGATNVSNSIQPTLVFDHAILPSSVNNNTIKLTDLSTTTFVNGITFSQSPDDKTVTMNIPSLTPGVSYRIDVWNTNTPGMGIQDTVDVYLANTYSIQFTTIVPYTIFYNVAGNNYLTLYASSAAFEYVGIYLSDTSSLIGNVPLFFSFTLRKIGNPTGTVTIRWARSSGSSVINIATFDASTLGTSDTVLSYNFLSNTQQFEGGDFISIEYLNGNSSNYIQVRFSTTGVFNGTATYIADRYYGSSTTNNATNTDLAGQIGIAN